MSVLTPWPEPRREDADENHYADQERNGLCDICGNRPGEIAQDGEWVCARCSAALEVAELDGDAA